MNEMISFSLLLFLETYQVAENSIYPSPSNKLQPIGHLAIYPMIPQKKWPGLTGDPDHNHRCANFHFRLPY